jgi:hypothetical protein
MRTDTFNTGILVAGMHRSGTSAMTGALQACGVALGGPLLSQDRSNEKGYLELKGAICIHDDFLKHYSQSWLSLNALPEGWEKSNEAEIARKAIRKLAREQFIDKTIWAVKDPRLCRLFPLWHQALPEISLGAVLIVRHPLEVANSLFVRDEFSINRSLLLWIHHVLDGEKNTRGVIRSKVLYADLIKDAPSIMTRLENELKVKWLCTKEEQYSNLSSWIEPRLNHHHSTNTIKRDSKFEPLIEKALELYHLFEQPDILNDAKTCDLYRQEFLDLISKHYGYLIQHEIDLMGDVLASAWEEYSLQQKNLTETIVSLTKTISDLRNTVSWKITKPLRNLGDAVGHVPKKKS